jgi:hypothetical protein
VIANILADIFSSAPQVKICHSERCEESAFSGSRDAVNDSRFLTLRRSE